jgi:HK97 gp10 family phage protein
MSHIEVDDRAWLRGLEQAITATQHDLNERERVKAERVKDRMVQLAPRAPATEHDPSRPHMADTITMHEVKDGEGQVAYEVGTPDPVAMYQEFGTSHNAPHPFARPAIEEERTA